MPPPPLPPTTQLDPQGNLFNIYMDGPKRRITPVGNIRDMKSFKVIAGGRQAGSCLVFYWQAGSCLVSYSRRQAQPAAAAMLSECV